MNPLRLFGLVAGWMVLSACSHHVEPTVPNGDSAPAEPSPAQLVVLHTNDTHGHVWGGNGVGSAAQRATLVESIREEARQNGSAVVLLDAGDVRTGTYCSDENQSSPDFAAMNAMGYDAMALGNHELDEPFEVLWQQRENLEFPILCANGLGLDSDEPRFAPFVVIERLGLRIALVGLVTPEAGSSSTHGAEAPIRFVDPIEAARPIVSVLSEQADVVIALSHIGLEGDRELARSVEGIDLIVGGHSHDALGQAEQVGGSWIVQAGNYGDFLGRVDLEVTPDGVTITSAELLSVPETLAPDPVVARILETYACPEQGEVLTHATAPINRDPLAGPGSSSSLSHLVAEAFRSVAGSDLSFVNRGGLRGDLPGGEITFGNVHGVLPFDNHLVVIDLTGAQLVELASTLISRGPGGSGMLQPGGMDFVLGPGSQAQVLIDGAPIDLERSFSVAVSSYLAGGGDRHPIIQNAQRIREVTTTNAQAFAEYLRQIPEISPTDHAHLRWVQPLPPPSEDKGGCWNGFCPKTVSFPQLLYHEPQW